MVIHLPHLEPYQKDLIHTYEENQHNKRIIVKSPRQCGKSIGMSILLLYASFKEPNSVSISISPIAAQSRKAFQDFIRIAAPLIRKSNATAMEVTLTNGSVVMYKSAESGQNLRGNTVKKAGILCIDEAAYITKDLFYEVLLPFTNVYHSTIIMTSTPRFREGLFYDCYNDGLNKDDESTITLNWCDYDLSKYLPQELLDTYKKSMPNNAFRSEYLAEFIDADGSVFSGYRECVGQTTEDTKEEIVISIDWGSGTGGDDTSLCFSQYLNGKVQIQKLLYFNKANAQETINIIISQVKRLLKEGYKDITVVTEANSIGEVFYQLLSDAINDLEEQYTQGNRYSDINITSQKVTTTQKTKDKWVKQLQVCFEQQKIVLPQDDKMLLELSAYECHISPNGLPSYENSSPSIHDDILISMMIGVDKHYRYVKEDTE